MMRRDRLFALAGFVAVVGLLLAGSFLPPDTTYGSGMPLTGTLTTQAAVGTPPRAEREYKLEFHCPAGSQYAEYDGLHKLQQELYKTFKKHLADPVWQVPRYTGNGYYMAREAMILASRDVYLDTVDHRLYEKAMCFRVRHRFKDLKRLMKHEADPFGERYFPYRCEFQAKVGRSEQEQGFSKVEEARLEFRVESLPFSVDNPPPPPPWHPRDYVPIAQTGMWDGQLTTPAASLVQWLQSDVGGDRLHLRPELVLVSQRLRMHLDMKTDFGSGPNPNQAFIITLDRSYVYEARSYLAYLERTLYGDAQRPPYAASFNEVEIEFERNVSTVLDERIKDTDDPKLKELYGAFRADQQEVCRLVKEIFGKRSIVVKPAPRSKYQKAFELLTLSAASAPWAG